MNDDEMPVGTWTIIHSDGQTTTIKTERTGDGGTEPEVSDDDNERVLAFIYIGGRLRAFPLSTIFEINFVPEETE